MKRTELRRKSAIARRTALKKANRKRKARELVRCYGPPERRAGVKAMKCAVPGCFHTSENAHLENGGAGRKADASAVANLCAGHHRLDTDSLHNLGSVELFDEVHGTDLWASAQSIEEMFPTKGGDR